MTAYGLLAVGLGAALGAWLRLGAGSVVESRVSHAALRHSVGGGYVIGLALAYFEEHAGLPPDVRLFVITGFLGGLTTFSTFSAETVSLLARRSTAGRRHSSRPTSLDRFSVRS